MNSKQEELMALEELLSDMRKLKSMKYAIEFNKIFIEHYNRVCKYYQLVYTDASIRIKER